MFFLHHMLTCKYVNHIIMDAVHLSVNVKHNINLCKKTNKKTIFQQIKLLFLHSFGYSKDWDANYQSLLEINKKWLHFDCKIAKADYNYLISISSTESYIQYLHPETIDFKLYVHCLLLLSFVFYFAQNNFLSECSWF